MIELIDEIEREPHNVNGAIEDGNGVDIESDGRSEEKDSRTENVVLHIITFFQILSEPNQREHEVNRKWVDEKPCR